MLIVILLSQKQAVVDNVRMQFAGCFSVSPLNHSCIICHSDSRGKNGSGSSGTDGSIGSDGIIIAVSMTESKEKEKETSSIHPSMGIRHN